MYEPWGMDVFHTPKKVFHVASHVELPPADPDGSGAAIPLPPCLIINLMVRRHPPVHCEPRNCADSPEADACDVCDACEALDHPGEKLAGLPS